MKRVGLLLLAVLLVSSAALFAHRALAEATPLAIAAWRLGLASLFFLGWEAALARRPQSLIAPQPPPLDADDKNTQVTLRALRLMLAGLCLAAHFVTWFASLQYTPVARATLLACTTPLWTTLGGVLLRRQRFTATYGVALALAGVGTALVTHGAHQTPSPATLRGDVLATLAGMLFAVYLLLVEGLHRTLSPRRQVTVTYSVAAVALWLGFLMQGGVTLRYSPGVWRALLGMTLGPQILGHTLLNAMLRHFPSSTVAFAILLEPVLAAWLAYVLLGQTVTPGQTVGGVVVLAALALVLLRQAPTTAPDL